MTNRFLTVALGASILAIAGQAQAHVPFLEGTDTTVGAPKAVGAFCYLQERSYYGQIEHPHDVDVYEIAIPAATEGYEFTAHVPLCPGDAARPHIAIVGPGLPRPANHAGLPFPVPARQGVVVAEWEDEGTYIEDFSGFEYLAGGEGEVDLQPGTYRIYVWDPSGATGDYNAIFGVDESCIINRSMFPSVIAGCGFLTDQQQDLYPSCERAAPHPVCCALPGMSGGACAE